MIRLMVPDIGDAEVAAVEEVLRSGRLVQGDRVAAFERSVAEAVGSSEAVAVSSGTAALHLSLLTLGIGPGDAVAVPTYSWPATANVIVLAGAEPVFIDIEPRSWGMDPERLEQAFRERPDIRAVMPVHAFGGMAEIGRLVEIASARRVPVVEDAACALGASVEGRAAGAWGTVGCFSFHPRKIVTTGEGGAVTTSDRTLANQIRSLRNHGITFSDAGPAFEAAGFNLRLTEFQAAMGLPQLSRLEQIVQQRQTQAEAYRELLAGSSVTCPSPRSPEAHTYQSFVVLLPPGCDRSRVIGTLKAQGIETTIGTYHIPATAFFARRGGIRRGHFPVTDEIADRALTLPLHAQLDLESQGEVVSRLLDAVR